MFRKYYTYNVAGSNGELIGGRVIRLGFWHTPHTAMRFAITTIPSDTFIIDFRRIK